MRKIYENSMFFSKTFQKFSDNPPAPKNMENDKEFFMASNIQDDRRKLGDNSIEMEFLFHLPLFN